MIIFLDANAIIYRVEVVEPFNKQLLTTVQDLVEKYPNARFEKIA
jgi:hypothetical protein